MPRETETASTSTDHSVTYDPEPPVVSNAAVDPDPTNGTIDVTASATVDDADGVLKPPSGLLPHR